MNRRRTSKPGLGFGSVVLLIAAAVVMATAGVFHAYIKNRQVNVSRKIQTLEDRISQHRLDIENLEVLLGDQLNQFLLGDRLKEISSDLRPIALTEMREISSGGPIPGHPVPPSASAPPGLAHRSSAAVGSLASGP